MTVRRCPGFGCSRVAPDRPFCDDCARLLETDTRRAVERLYRPGQRQTKAFDRVYTIALRELLDARAGGTAAARPRAFEW
jgi:hypothetical protein